MRETFRPIRLEIGLAFAGETTCKESGKAISLAAAVPVTSFLSYKKAMQVKEGWKLSPSPKQGSSPSFRLLSPWLQSLSALRKCALVLQKIKDMEGGDIIKTINSIVGLRIHVLACGVSFAVLKHLVQLMVKYELVLDSYLPASRRTSSVHSKKYFQSISSTVARGLAAPTQKQLLDRIESCCNTDSLLELVNPSNSSCYTINFQNLAHENENDLPFLEFRQHSTTTNLIKIETWITICTSLWERAMMNSHKVALAFHSRRSLEEQTEILLTTTVFQESNNHNRSLRNYFLQRQQDLKSDKNGPAVAAALPKRKPTNDSVSASGKKKSKSKPATCACCFQTITTKQLTCACQDGSHIFCVTCIRSYTKQELFTNHNSSLVCIAMGESCSSPYNTRQLEAILPAKHKQKLTELQFTQMTQTKQNRVLCDCPKCGERGLVKTSTKTFSCPNGSCRFHACRQCDEEAHPGLTCAQVERQAVRSGRVSIEEAMSTEQIRLCPNINCRTPIVRESGCNTMTCSRCRRSFCYSCRHERCTCGHTPSPLGEAAAVRQAGLQALSQVNDAGVRGELNEIVDRLV